MVIALENSKIFAVEPIFRETTKESGRKIFRGRERVTNAQKVNRLRKLISEEKERKSRFSRGSVPLENASLTYVDGLYGPLALVISISSSFLITILPAHNVLTKPNYWYEVIFSFVQPYK